MPRAYVPHEIKANKALSIALAADGRKGYEIANAARIRPDDLSGYKSGRMVPSPERQQRIADALGLPVAELFGSDSEAVSA